MADIQLTGASREKVSRSELERMRKEGKIPAILYGKKNVPKMLWINALAFGKVFTVAGESSIITLTVGEGKKANVIIQDLAHDVMTNHISHIDFFEVSMDEELEARIPLEFIGESLAVREQGGILVKTLEEVVVSCLPKDLPHAISVDLSALLDFTVHIQVKDLNIPAGVKVLTDELTTIALVEAPRTEAEMEALDEKVDVDVTKVEGVVKDDKDDKGDTEELPVTPSEEEKK